jgi:hypothetical protein
MVLATVALLLHSAWALPAAADVSSAIAATATTSAPENSQSQSGDQPTRTAPSSTDSPKLTSIALEPVSENSQSLATVRLPSIEPGTPKRVAVENLPSRRNWLILSVVQHGAATFDAYSTRQAVTSGAQEADPFMRPFAQSPAIYIAIQGAPVVLDYAARRMQRSPNSFLRRTWWLPQSASTGLFLFSGIHNLHVANRP